MLTNQYYISLASALREYPCKVLGIGVERREAAVCTLYGDSFLAVVYGDALLGFARHVPRFPVT